MFLFKVVPIVVNSSFQELLKNILSRSVIIDLGTVCFVSTLSIKVSATCFAEKGCFRVTK